MAEFNVNVGRAESRPINTDGQGNSPVQFTSDNKDTSIYGNKIIDDDPTAIHHDSEERSAAETKKDIDNRLQAQGEEKNPKEINNEVDKTDKLKTAGDAIVKTVMPGFANVVPDEVKTSIGAATLGFAYLVPDEVKTGMGAAAQGLGQQVADGVKAAAEFYDENVPDAVKWSLNPGLELGKTIHKALTDEEK